MKSTKEYKWTNAAGKEIRIVYSYEKKTIEDIRDWEGYEINNGKKVIEDSKAVVYMDGKLIADASEVREVKTDVDVMLAPIKNVKIGTLYIGGVYISDASTIAAIKAMVAEAMAEGTEAEAAEQEATEAAAEKATKIEKCKATVARAEAQNKIPTASEYARMKAQDESIVAVPYYVTAEQYMAAKNYLAANA